MTSFADYSRIATDYDTIAAFNGYAEAPVRVVHAFMQAAGGRAIHGLRVLDLGCGTGLVTQELLRRAPFSSVVGLEPDESMRAQCVAKRLDSSRFTLVGGGLCPNASLPFREAAFDAVLSCGVFEWVHPMDEAVTEILRVTTPRGFLAFTYQTHTGDAGHVATPRLHSHGSDSHTYSQAHVDAAVRQAGARVVSHTQFPAYSYSKPSAAVWYGLVCAVKPAL